MKPALAETQGRIMVVWAGEGRVPDAALLAELAPHPDVRLTWVRQINDRISLIDWQAPGELDVETWLQSLAVDPRIESAQASGKRRVQFVPQDPLYSNQWYLYESVGIEAADAWDLQRGSASVIIALLDTGVLAHEDIDSTRILPGYDFFSDAVLDNDGTPGWDNDPTDPGDAEAENDCEPGSPATTSSWHGLTVSGILMANTDNLLGVAGIDHFARLLPVRVFGKCGARFDDILDAMRWAAGLPVTGVPINANPADVINLSFGGQEPCGPAEQVVINEVLATGVVLVAAAGNEGGDVAQISPGSCRGVITVAAVSRSGSLASYSNRGEEVSISAAAGDSAFDGVATTYNDGLDTAGNDTYAALKGTSFATAQVSAVVSLLLAETPHATPAQILQALQDSAKPFPDASCNTTLCGAGLLDAAAAIQAVQNLPQQPASPAVSNGGGGGGCTLHQQGRPDPLWAAWLIWLLVKMNPMRNLWRSIRV